MGAASIITAALFLLLGLIAIAIGVHMALGAYLDRVERQDEGREE